MTKTTADTTPTNEPQWPKNKTIADTSAEGSR